MKRKILWLFCTLLSLFFLVNTVSFWLEKEATEKVIQEALDKRGWTDRYEDLSYNMKFGDWEMFVRYDSFPGEQYVYQVNEKLSFKDKIQSLFGKKLNYGIFGEGHCDEHVKCETKRKDQRYKKRLEDDAKGGMVHNRSTGLGSYREGEWLKQKK
ncbi:hypothetical protein [Macrococcus bovicus]|uniref:DUF3139 domain-containing protein n=1 Tax=Macrococcus bovicus TaxID=69968 RepID=A0A4R6BZ37_9STAP|nr:hypothetical protein [Macrococcus bovicus]TDM13568.1 hypothetical protein ERX55_08215 [Macrococcus bovicus]